MDLARFWKHVAMTPSQARRAFPDRTMEAIARAIGEGEKTHRGEVCVVVEAELSTGQLWRGLTARDRARELFAAQGVWNTEENNGVLIYILLAERDVEIVADRGIDARVSPGEWQAIVDAMDAHFHEERYEDGAVAGVRGVGALLARHFPDASDGRNQLGDRPVLM
jgi:uncharacterized membrane protein